MKVLIIDEGGVGGGLAKRAADYNHEVYWFIEPKPENNAKKTGRDLDPLIEKVTDWIPLASNMDLILTTENGKYLDQLERFRKKGINVYAPSQKCADLEHRRDLGLKFFEKYKLPVPEYMVFKSFKEAANFVRKNPETWVFKTIGEVKGMGSDEAKSLSYVPKSPEQLVQQLLFWEKQGLKVNGDVLLQKKVDGLCEMSVSAYMGPGGWCGPWIHCFEHKKLMNGELGPNTGEMGSIMRATKKSELANMILKPIEDELVDMDACCNFDLNCMIDKKGQPWILEATSRFGWPATNIELEMFQGDVMEQLVDVCQGADSIKMTPDWAIGVVLTIPDFPYSNYGHDKVTGIPLYGVTRKNVDHIHPQGLMLDKVLDKNFEEIDGFVSTSNYLAVVTETGVTIESARSKVYSILDDLEISNKTYRLDIGQKVEKVLPELEGFGLM